MAANGESQTVSEYIVHHLTNLTYGKLPAGFERYDGSVVPEGGQWTMAHGAAESAAMGFNAIHVDSMIIHSHGETAPLKCLKGLKGSQVSRSCGYEGIPLVEKGICYKRQGLLCPVGYKDLVGSAVDPPLFPHPLGNGFPEGGETFGGAILKGIVDIVLKHPVHAFPDDIEGKGIRVRKTTC